MDYLNQNYRLVVEAHKIYLTTHDYPTSNILKFIQFFLEIGLVNKDKTISAETLQNIFTHELGKQYNTLQKHVIYRGEFLSKLIRITVMNFETYPQGCADIQEYFTKVLFGEVLSAATKKVRGSYFNFRKTFWTPQVNLLLTLNKALLTKVF